MRIQVLFAGVFFRLFGGVVAGANHGAALDDTEADGQAELLPMRELVEMHPALDLEVLRGGLGVERTVCPAVRGLWLVAGLSLAGGMVLAALYASRGYIAPLPWLDIPWMRALHGTLNALGFSLAALLGWCRAGRACCSGK